MAESKSVFPLDIVVRHVPRVFQDIITNPILAIEDLVNFMEAYPKGEEEIKAEIKSRAENGDWYFQLASVGNAVPHMSKESKDKIQHVKVFDDSDNMMLVSDKCLTSFKMSMNTRNVSTYRYSLEGTYPKLNQLFIANDVILCLRNDGLHGANFYIKSTNTPLVWIHERYINYPLEAVLSEENLYSVRYTTYSDGKERASQYIRQLNSTGGPVYICDLELHDHDPRNFRAGQQPIALRRKCKWYGISGKRMIRICTFNNTIELHLISEEATKPEFSYNIDSKKGKWKLIPWNWTSKKCKINGTQPQFEQDILLHLKQGKTSTFLELTSKGPGWIKRLEIENIVEFGASKEYLVLSQDSKNDGKRLLIYDRRNGWSYTCKSYINSNIHLLREIFGCYALLCWDQIMFIYSLGQNRVLSILNVHHQSELFNAETIFWDKKLCSINSVLKSRDEKYAKNYRLVQWKAPPILERAKTHDSHRDELLSNYTSEFRNKVMTDRAEERKKSRAASCSIL